MSATPVQIVLDSGDHSFTLDNEALARILMKNEVKNRDLVILSVAGAFRKGKSFMLDFFLRYLYSRVSVIVTKLIVVGNQLLVMFMKKKIIYFSQAI